MKSTASTPKRSASSRSSSRSKKRLASNNRPSFVREPIQWLLKLLGLRDRVKRREAPAPASDTLTSSILGPSQARRLAVPVLKEGEPHPRDAAEARDLRRALAEVLDQHEASRKTLMHLDAVERALGAQGLPGLNGLPLPVLQAALRQLEGVVMRWTSHLASLRARLSLVIIEREQVSAEPRTGAMLLSTFGSNSKVEVEESGSVTTFLEIHAQWENGGKPKVAAPADQSVARV